MSCITEILKLKGDKEVLVPPGNWIAVEGGGTYKDHEYLIVLTYMGHRCGYVALKHDKEDENIDISCHGGITFRDKEHDLKDLLSVPCNDIWIGFDCVHWNDFADAEAHKKYFGEEFHNANATWFGAPSHLQTTKGFNYVENECHSIIDQLIEVVV